MTASLSPFFRKPMHYNENSDDLNSSRSSGQDCQEKGRDRPADKFGVAVDMAGVQKFDSGQPPWSLIWRAPEAAMHSLKPVAAEAGLSRVRFSLAWALRERNVAS